MSCYTTTNFKSKKALKEAVARGERVTVWNRGQRFYGHGGLEIAASEGSPQKIYLEGPHYPEPHRWYASAMISHGAIVEGTVK